MRSPFFAFVLSFVALWLSIRIGILLRRRAQDMDQESREDFTVVQGATLTLLGLVIGFTFSMAISRYDQRKMYEEEEANAIGTEFLRVAMLPAAYVVRTRELLKKYLEQRIAFYQTQDASGLEQIDRNTTQLQTDLWSATRAGAEERPSPLTALAASGMNDVLNSQGYTQAAWLNRIPPAAWILMAAIALLGSLLVGIGARRKNVFLTIMLPLVISIAFFLIADLDSPRRGLIRMRPTNLITLSESLKSTQ
ncbi:MAG TPA: hypothetical protein VKH81_24575 [Candidatus Angelobacter sp.]|nr:hypothetical protein [Candidatus Angelobacter sp.]